MPENYITKINVVNSINVKELEIPLSMERRQHLILTGKNGSGKTSLLTEINKYLTQIDNGNFYNYAAQVSNLDSYKRQLENRNLSEQDKIQVKNRIKSTENWFSLFGGTEMQFSNSENIISDLCQRGEFLLAFFDAKRHTDLNIPQGINKISLQKKYQLYDKANINFIQYIVNLKADRSFARDDNEFDVVEKIDNWFERLENRLKEIFKVNKLELKFDRISYNFDIVTDSNIPVNFNNLSDGYSAIISIVTELLLRMEAHDVKSYDLEGIVIIDEIETHLHVDLQKTILPFLTDFFPRLQFIVTTHSPFVLSSLSNATICDLETRTVTTDLSGYSYDALIESFFNSDKYSDILKTKINEFEKLLNKDNTNREDREKIENLKEYLSALPKFLSKELHSKLLDIEINYLSKNK